MRRSEKIAALAAYATGGLIGCALLGAVVAKRTPSRIDVEAMALRGSGVPLAVAFTRLGYWPQATLVCAAAVASAVLADDHIEQTTELVLSHTISQIAAGSMKLLYRRTRPDYWLIKQEADTSYPSGHSATAMTLYLGLAVVAANAKMPNGRRVMVVTTLALCSVGIPWSRLALGAHYLTDVIGGLLFGSSWLAGSIALDLTLRE